MPKSARGPMRKVILIAFSEYTRLLTTEKKLGQLMQEGHKLNTDVSAASELEGDGAASSSGVFQEAPSKSQVFVSAEQNCRDAYKSIVPIDVASNFTPPPLIPNVKSALLPDRSEDLAREAKRDKTLTPSLPMNDPLGAIDSSLTPGHPPLVPFVAKQTQHGGPSTKEEQKQWYKLNVSYSSEESDGNSDFDF
jgi:hypothetical protein